MKNMSLNALIVLLLCLGASSCSKDSLTGSPGDEASLKEAVMTRNDGTREIPFKAKFYTRRVPEKIGEVVCNDPTLPGPNYQYGEGTGTHLGKLTSTFTFCGDGGFYSGQGYFVAADGDSLFIEIAGQVFVEIPWDPATHYDAYFQDPFSFVGGTGRFEGASGGGMTDSLVDLWDEDTPFPGPIIENHRTDHVWTGTLILPNGN